MPTAGRQPDTHQGHPLCTTVIHSAPPSPAPVPPPLSSIACMVSFTARPPSFLSPALFSLRFASDSLHRTGTVRLDAGGWVCEVCDQSLWALGDVDADCGGRLESILLFTLPRFLSGFRACKAGSGSSITYPPLASPPVLPHASPMRPPCTELHQSVCAAFASAAWLTRRDPRWCYSSWGRRPCNGYGCYCWEQMVSVGDGLRDWCPQGEGQASTRGVGQN